MHNTFIKLFIDVHITNFEVKVDVQKACLSNKVLNPQIFILYIYIYIFDLKIVYIGCTLSSLVL